MLLLPFINSVSKKTDALSFRFSGMILGLFFKKKRTKTDKNRKALLKNREQEHGKKILHKKKSELFGTDLLVER